MIDTPTPGTAVAVIGADGTRAVAHREPNAGGLAPMTFEQLVGMGDALVRTGFLPEHIKTGAQAAAIILTGREMGMAPMRAIRSLAMVKGKVTESADSQLARFKADGGRAKWVQLDEHVATLLLRHPNGDEHDETFTYDDAERAGLTRPGRNGEPSMYAKHPKAMLRSRAITAGLKSIGWEGGIGAYDPEELSFPAAPIGSTSADDDGVSTDPADQADDQRVNASEPQPSCPKCGGLMWDNRAGKKNPKAPDYKCRSRSCDGLIWPGAWPPAPAASDAQRAQITALLPTAKFKQARSRATIDAKLADTAKPLNAKEADELIQRLKGLQPTASDKAADELKARQETATTADPEFDPNTVQSTADELPF